MPRDLFRPSEYTAALLLQLRMRRPCTGRVLDMGTGSGVVLAALARAGARELVGVDIEPEAVQRTRALLASHGITHASMRCGDLWKPVAGEQFDLVVFNPPQLPLQDDMHGERLRTWSEGGRDGRAVLDRFLCGLADHLAPGGAALVTHNTFLGLERTMHLLASRALRAETRQTVAVHMPAYKLCRLPQSWLERHLGGTLQRVGPYVFGDFHVLEIRHADATPAP